MRHKLALKNARFYSTPLTAALAGVNGDENADMWFSE